MWEFTATVDIDCTADEAWAYLTDVEQWWVASNPDHVRLEVRSDGDGLAEGTRIFIEEYVAGIRGRGEGTITRVVDGERVCWEAAAFRYRLLGLSLVVREGVEWKLASLATGGIVLSAHVWARFPRSPWGRLAELVAKRLMNGLQKDYEHALTELHYIKGQLEQAH
jgi:hypothetical protein